MLCPNVMLGTALPSATARPSSAPISTNGAIAPDSAFTSHQERTSVPPASPPALLIFLLPPGNPFRNGSVWARLQSCRNRRETTAALAAEAVCPFFANAPSPQTPHSFRAKPALTAGVPPALLMFRLCLKPLLVQLLILYRRMPRRIPTRRVPKVRKHRMYTGLRLRRFDIELHPPILPGNVPLVMHHHSPQRSSRARARHQVLSPKVIARIHQRARCNHRQNHPLNHRG